MDHVLYQIFKIILNISYKHKAATDNPSVLIYLNQIETGITFIIKTGHYLKLLTLGTMKLFRSTKSKITKNEYHENVPHLEITEVVLIDCNIGNNDYTFVPNRSFGQLLDISPKNFIFLKTYNLEFSKIEGWFTDQNSKPLKIYDKINITLVFD